jgi:hypothetical protein
MKHTDWPDWVFLALPFIALLLLYLTYLIDADIHELGHAIACTAQGYTILSWSVFVPGRSDLNCTNNDTALFAIGGTLSSLLCWTVFTAAFLSRPPRLRNAHWFQFLSVVWAGWSFWCLGELGWWALQTHENPPHDDSARFVAATGIEPRLVITSCLLLLTILIGGLLIPTAWAICTRLRNNE